MLHLLEKGGFPNTYASFLFLFLNKRMGRMICYAQQPAPQARKKPKLTLKHTRKKVFQRNELKCVLYCRTK